MLESVQMWIYVEMLVPKGRNKPLTLVLDIWPSCLVGLQITAARMMWSCGLPGPQGTLPNVVNQVERMPRYQYHLHQLRAVQSTILTLRAISLDFLQRREHSKTEIMHVKSPFQGARAFF